MKEWLKAIGLAFGAMFAVYLAGVVVGLFWFGVCSMAGC